MAASPVGQDSVQINRQQVSVKAATTIIGRLVRRAGTRITADVPENIAWKFPEPKVLAEADLSDIGMPGRRVAAIQNLARAVASGELSLDNLCERPKEFRRDLLGLPGIGPWTVEYVAMRALGDSDAWPGSDLVLMQAIIKRDPTLADISLRHARTDGWSPYRAYAAMHLWSCLPDTSKGSSDRIERA